MDTLPDQTGPGSASSLPEAAAEVTAQSGAAEGSSTLPKPEPDQPQGPSVSAALPGAPLPEASTQNGHASAAEPVAPADHAEETGRIFLHGYTMHRQHVLILTQFCWPGSQTNQTRVLFVKVLTASDIRTEGQLLLLLLGSCQSPSSCMHNLAQSRPWELKHECICTHDGMASKTCSMQESRKCHLSEKGSSCYFPEA